MRELTHRVVETNGIRMHVAEKGEGPLIVLCHGWPELWHSWRHQIDPLVDAGYRVVVPDQRGYGGTDCPEAVEAYDILQLTGDLVGLLDALGADDAVFVGHDWGAPVVWNLSLLAPERVRAVAALSVPFTPRARRDPITTLESIFQGKFFYILYFQAPGVAEAELSVDVETTFRYLLRSSGSDLRDAVIAPETARTTGFLATMPPPGPLPEWLSQEDLDVYVAEFRRTGFAGGLNLVPQHPSQLGADGAPERCEGARASDVPRGRPRPGSAVHARHEHRRRRAGPAQQRVTPRCGPLGPAGATQGGQHGAPLVPLDDRLRSLRTADRAIFQEVWQGAVAGQSARSRSRSAHVLVHTHHPAGRGQRHRRHGVGDRHHRSGQADHGRRGPAVELVVRARGRDDRVDRLVPDDGA